MAPSGKVVWSEGMFLRTQHFQQQDARLESLVREALAALPYPAFGFRTLELDEAALQSGLFGIANARGHFSDGTSFSLDGSVPSLAPVPVPAGKDEGIVHLALPVETSGAATIDPVSGSVSGARFRGAIETVRDAVRGGADAEDVELAHLQPRFLLPEEEAAGYVTLPIACLRGRDTSGAVMWDSAFLPPAQTIKAVPWYHGLLQKILTDLKAVSEVHSAAVRAGTGASVENLLKLELANRAQARIAHLVAQMSMHPADLYLELVGLAGEMSTYHGSRQVSDLPDYDHIDPQPSYLALSERLKELLFALSYEPERAKSLKVVRHSENVWTVRIDNPQILQTSRILVRVGADMSDNMLRRLFVDQTTVGAADEFEKLWTAKLTGIPLKPLNSQPREIPYDGDRLCLELDRNSEHWASLAEAPGFVIGVAGKLDREPDIDCYAIAR